MMIDSHPICRVCARRGITRYATWRLDDATVANWALCDHHAQLLAKTPYGLQGRMTQLDDAVQVRSQERMNTK